MKSMRRALKRTYTSMRLANPSHQLSRIDKLSLKMLGSSTDPNLHSKAGEARDIIYFVLKMLRLHHTKLDGGHHLLRAGEASYQFVTLMNSAGRRLTLQEQRSMFDLMKQHVVAFVDAGGVAVPKTHEMLHVAWKCRFFGNCRYYSTYEDETANGVAKKICHKCHPRTFAWSFWEKYFVTELLRKMSS